MSNYLKKRVAEQEADDRMDEICQSREEEYIGLVIGGMIDREITKEEEKAEKKAAKKKIVTKTFFRTGSNPNAGLNEIMKSREGR